MCLRRFPQSEETCHSSVGSDNLTLCSESSAAVSCKSHDMQELSCRTKREKFCCSRSDEPQLSSLSLKLSLNTTSFDQNFQQQVRNVSVVAADLRVNVLICMLEFLMFNTFYAVNKHLRQHSLTFSVFKLHHVVCLNSTVCSVIPPADISSQNMCDHVEKP